MKVSNALYTYPVLSVPGLRDDYDEGSSFSIAMEKEQTGVKEISVKVTVELKDETITNLIKTGKAKIICHSESPLSSHRATREISLFDMETLLPIEPQLMRGMLEITPFVVATEDIAGFTSGAFSDFYAGEYDIEKGDVLAFAPTVEIEIEPEDLDRRPTQSIIKIGSHELREMRTDLSDDYILVRLPKETYFGYKQLSKKGNAHYKISLMAVILPALMDAIFLMKTGDGESEGRIWSRVIKSKLKAGGRGSDVTEYDPLVHAQFLLNNPADDTFTPIIEKEGED